MTNKKPKLERFKWIFIFCQQNFRTFWPILLLFDRRIDWCLGCSRLLLVRASRYVRSLRPPSFCKFRTAWRLLLARSSSRIFSGFKKTWVFFTFFHFTLLLPWIQSNLLPRWPQSRRQRKTKRKLQQISFSGTFTFDLEARRDVDEAELSSARTSRINL